LITGKRPLFFIFCFFAWAVPARAEIEIVKNENFIFSVSPYLRTDGVVLNNNIDLDSKNKDDSSAYLGIDYSLGLNLKFADEGPEAYLKLERNGPYDYDAPLFIHNTLYTSTAKVDRYRGAELLPHVEEFWYDTSLFGLPSRAKGGLFVYEVANNIVSPSDYENYALSLYSEKENLSWRFFYCRPDLVNKSFLGPRIEQEREQGSHYTPNKANFFAADAVFTVKNHSLQPYVEVLSDYSGEKRSNLFSTPTHEDILGVFGMAWDVTLDKLSFGLEAARNFGRAKSSDADDKDVAHCGYLVYADASYAFERFVPHSRFAYASGNKVTPEMAGDDTFTSGKNRAFSAYSPFNTNLSDSIYPIGPEAMPLVAMGWGDGLNYGIARPTTFSDPYLFDNLILVCLGFDFQMTQKLSLTLDWWYLRAAERGIGTFAGETRTLSTDLGHELDLYVSYDLTPHVSLGLFGGYFFPGQFYKEERDDDAGSLFTPFLRGDGEADGAYQIEMSVTISY
jgi:hypothetical protein